MQTRGLARTYASYPATHASHAANSAAATSYSANSAAVTSSSGGVGSSNIVTEARRYLGGNPTGRGSLWCARFMNMVLQHSGYRGTGSDMASSFARYGQRVSGPQVGAIAVMGRQSDHDLRQQRQPGPRSADLARAHPRLRHTDELKQDWPHLA
jgi:hypothetical protein